MHRLLLPLLVGIPLAGPVRGDTPGAAPSTSHLRQTNNEVLVRVSLPASTRYRLESSTDLEVWEGLASGVATASSTHLDSAAPRLPLRFYRTVLDSGTAVPTGDLLTASNGPAVLRPINHATLILSWNGLTVYVDPVGGGARFAGLPRPDIVLITHAHSDHFEVSTLTAVCTNTTIILAPAVVQASLSAALKPSCAVMTNGSSTNLLGVTVEAVAMYNLTSAYHPKGTGNGYVVTLGGRRIYLSGDTEDIPEMRALRDIDVAFVCMNLPFTMTVTRAASAVRKFRPRVVYPYHYSDSNVNEFKRLVGTDVGVEVRLRKWY